MNWIEIDKFLYELYDKFYEKEPKKFYEAAMKKFSWDEKQAKDNTDFIVKSKSVL